MWREQTGSAEGGQIGGGGRGEGGSTESMELKRKMYEKAERKL